MPEKPFFRAAKRKAAEPQRPIQVGRTPWDFLATAAPWLLLPLLLVIAIVWGVAHANAAPGTQVNLFGLIQYQKGNQVPTDVPPAHYVFVSGEKLWVNRPIVILDKALHVRRLRDSKNKDTLHLSSANIVHVRAAARDRFGRALPLTADKEARAIVLSDPGIEGFIEVEYKGSYFSIEVAPSADLPNFQLTVQPLPAPALRLMSFDVT